MADSRQLPSALEQDCIMGTFTHQPETYLPALLTSIKEHLPQIEFEVVLRDGPINQNMYLLWQRFAKSGKRWWLFLDHDIQVLHQDTVQDTIITMLRYNWAIGGVYSVMQPENQARPYTELVDLVYSKYPEAAVREVRFQPGYFMLVDSQKIGHIAPALDLPDGNTAVDSTYCVETLAAGHRIGLVPHVVYHVKKEVWLNQEAYDKTVQYVAAKWGGFWNWDIATGCVID
jgi:hypothetical protein